MEKRRVRGRLQLLNDGREHYLNFLRNLTPQIILLSTIWLASEKFDIPPRIDFNNTFNTFVFLALVCTFSLAVYANITRFRDQCFVEFDNWHSEQQKTLAAQGIKGRRHYIEMAKAIYRYKFVETIEIFTIFISIIIIALAIVIGMSLHSANGIWRDSHHTEIPQTHRSK